jgi:hypothetical protein
MDPRMKRKRLIWGLCLTMLALVVASVVLCYTEPAVRFTEANWQKVVLSMTEDEVAAVLGVPAGDYRTEAKKAQLWSLLETKGPQLRMAMPERNSFKSWIGDQGAILTVFDKRGKLSHYQLIKGDSPTLIQRLQRALKG